MSANFESLFADCEARDSEITTMEKISEWFKFIAEKGISKEAKLATKRAQDVLDNFIESAAKEIMNPAFRIRWRHFSACRCLCSELIFQI